MEDHRRGSELDVLDPGDYAVSAREQRTASGHGGFSLGNNFEHVRLAISTVASVKIEILFARKIWIWWICTHRITESRFCVLPEIERHFDGSGLECLRGRGKLRLGCTHICSRRAVTTRIGLSGP